MIRHREQRGVALIFALGILSLILVMGMAFLGNALIGQKIAFNSRETASARLTARNALDRAMSQLVLFNLSQCGQFASSYLSPEASSVFSRIDGGGTVLENEQGDTKDQLAGADSKLNVGSTDMLLYHGNKSRARWIYVHRNGIETNGQKTDQTANPIIARYAYQVLPPAAVSDTAFSRNSLSLYAVTSGADGVAGVNSDADTRRKPQTHRWGIDADELCISDLSMFSAHWTGSSPWSPQHEFDNFQNLLSGTSGTNPFYWNKTDADAKKLVESRKRWLRYAFTEGRGRTAREAYSDGAGVWHTRFNLSDGTPFYAANDDSNGNWYSRLLGEMPASAADEANKINGGGGVTDPLKNSATAVERLARVPDPFEEGFYCDKDGLDGDEADFSLGIPFLRRIGSNSEKGAFDAVENLRKQIAANLNDYCDSDSVPTSDVAADTWGNLIDNSLSTIVPPAYTGNEKTLYINEIAFGFKLNDSKLSMDGGGLVFKFDGAGDQLKTELIAELVGVYKGLPSYNFVELKGKLHSLKAKLKVTLKGKVTVQYTKSETPHSEEVDLGSGVSVEKVFELESAEDIDIKNTTAWSNSSNYWLGRVDLTAKMKTGVTADLKDQIASLSHAEGNPVTVTAIDKIDEIKVEVLEISFDLGNLALFLRDKADPAEATVNNWVDFVRVAKGERAPEGTLVPLILNKAASDTGNWFDPKLSEATGNTKGFFYCGSVQAIDPRQNLNAKLSNDEANDWSNAFAPTITQLDLTNPSENYWNNFGSRLKGSVNVCSNPSDPKDAKTNALTVGVDCDKETATDPAWLGDGVDEHISTAVIRNRPMRSPWELGFIHRGIPFQTINLKKAGGYGDSPLDNPGDLPDGAHADSRFSRWDETTGTLYRYGDAGILDQIKMTEYNKSFGKIDVGTLLSTAPDWWVGTSETENFKSHNLALYKALFRNIRAGQKAEDFLTESANLSTVTGTLTGTKLVDSDMPSDLPPSTSTSVKLRSKFFKGLEPTFKTEAGANDAAQEELIGKTVNLIDANSCSPGNVCRIVIVAQTVRDMEGAGTLGKFDVTFPDVSDPEKNVYTDEILGECRMLATVEKVTTLEGTDKIPRVKLRIRQIEYLD